MRLKIDFCVFVMAKNVAAKRMDIAKKMRAMPMGALAKDVLEPKKAEKKSREPMMNKGMVIRFIVLDCVKGDLKSDFVFDVLLRMSLYFLRMGWLLWGVVIVGLVCLG